VKGVRAISNGGYHRWPTITDGVKPDDASSIVLLQYGKLSESMRTNSECAFSIFKKKERILRLALLVHTRSYVGNIDCTCIAIHSMLLQWRTTED